MSERKKRRHPTRWQIDRANPEMNRRTGGPKLIALDSVAVGHGAYRLHPGAGRNSGKSVHEVARRRDGIATLMGLVQSGRLSAADQDAVLAYLRRGGGVQTPACAETPKKDSLRKLTKAKVKPANAGNDRVGTFVINVGAYKGRTVAEVASTGGGREYLNTLLRKKKLLEPLRRAILDHAEWFDNWAPFRHGTGATCSPSTHPSH